MREELVSVFRTLPSSIQWPIAMCYGYSQRNKTLEENDEAKFFLHGSGWIRSLNGRPTDVEGAPLPWLTYGAIHFLGTRVSESMSVLEYGGGRSTLWWGKRVKRVYTIEHDEEWCDQLSREKPANVELFHRPSGSSGYIELGNTIASKVDIIVIDGRRRSECAVASSRSLKDTGVIVWDDSKRQRYQEGMRLLRQGGFKAVPFYGMSPVNLNGRETSIFYRGRNCFGL